MKVQSPHFHQPNQTLDDAHLFWIMIWWESRGPLDIRSVSSAQIITVPSRSSKGDPNAIPTIASKVIRKTTFGCCEKYVEYVTILCSWTSEGTNMVFCWQVNSFLSWQLELKRVRSWTMGEEPTSWTEGFVWAAKQCQGSFGARLPTQRGTDGYICTTSDKKGTISQPVVQ